MLSVRGKLFSSVIMERIKNAVNNTVRQHQVGVRHGRCCCDQIYLLRVIIEKTSALNSKLLVNFVDFRKTFDCVHRPSVCNVLKCYGIPEKITDQYYPKVVQWQQVCSVEQWGDRRMVPDYYRGKAGMHSVTITIPACYGLDTKARTIIVSYSGKMAKMAKANRPRLCRRHRSYG